MAEMIDPAREVLENLAKINPPKIIEGEEAARVYAGINEQMKRVAQDYEIMNARSETAAAYCVINC